ncbi:MAG: creatininase family protein [Armatimonadetes bacterium]|nr:creatininase family protein [Armatimonadota bacterium]
MKLADLTWQDADDVNRDVVVLVPTGSLEQHGPHLPLFTDTLLVTAVAEAIEAELPSKVLLTPTVWHGCSAHHISFAGTVSASFEGYEAAVMEIARSLMRNGLRKFFLINGHGGNTESNGIACRKLKAESPDCIFGHSGYFAFIPDDVLEAVMEGPAKRIQHACEAEASLMMHLHGDLVRKGRLRDDGLSPEPPVQGLTLFFDEITEQGSLGYATLATAEKGKTLFDVAVKHSAENIERLADGFVLKGIAE